MKKIAFILLLPLCLTACESYDLNTDELRSLKPACSGGHLDVCADIGHKVRRAQSEAGYLLRKQ